MTGLPPDSSSLIQGVLQALAFQLNGEDVGSELALNLENGSQIYFSMVDDPANHRVVVQAGIPGPGEVGGQIGIGLYPDEADGFIIASNDVGDPILYATVPGDSEYRFLAYPSGILGWGPGNAGVDVELLRSGAQGLEVYSPIGTAYLTVEGENGVGVINATNLYIGEDGAQLGFFGAAPTSRRVPTGGYSSLSNAGTEAFIGTRYYGVSGTGFQYTVSDIITGLQQLGLFL